MLLAPLPLTAPKITTLEAAAAHGPHPQMRRRAQAVLGHHRGASIAGRAFRRGLQHGQRVVVPLASPGAGRAGRGGPLGPSAQAAARGPKKVVDWLGPATQQLRERLLDIRRAYGIQLHGSMLRRLARRAGYRWKRCRRSLRAQRDAAAFGAAQQTLRAWHAAEAQGGPAVVYVDECRFSRQAPVPYAWQRRGQPPVQVPAVRGAGGYSVLGFWQAHVPGQPVHAYVRAGSLTADLFVEAVHAFCRHRSGPTVLVLDNASIHTAHVVRACQAEWAAKGLALFFLPPYSPELNHIELLWHRCKHYWIRPHATITSPSKPYCNASNTCSKGLVVNS